MDGEHKFMAMVYGVLALCFTVLYSFLFFSLWPYREWVGISLLVVVIGVVLTCCIVHVKGKLNEQALRHRRYHYHEEIPLDRWGEPRYLPADAQANPHRMSRQQWKREEYLYD